MKQIMPLITHACLIVLCGIVVHMPFFMTHDTSVLEVVKMTNLKT